MRDDFVTTTVEDVIGSRGNLNAIMLHKTPAVKLHFDVL
jgi:hypothetical protein